MNPKISESEMIAFALALGLIHLGIEHIPPTLNTPRKAGPVKIRSEGSFVDLPNLPPLFVYGAILVGFVITNLIAIRN